MTEIYFSFLNGPDIDALEMGNDEILDAVEAGLAAQGAGETVIEPRVHLMPDPAFKGHFNVLRGYIAPLGVAGVKIVGDYVENYTRGLPSEMALLNLFDPRTGMPVALLDAAAITDMRTGAMTALGAKYLARKDSRVLGNVGARGSSYWNVRLLDHLFDFAEIRVHSRRPESYQPFAERLGRDLGKSVLPAADWQSCLEGADVMVEASRLSEPEPKFRTAWIKRGATVIPYGTKSSVEDDLTDAMDKIVVDDWGQCTVGPFGCLRRHIDAGRVTRESIHGELCEIVAGDRPGREDDDETILFWHRGLSLSDIALGHAMLEKAKRLGIGQELRYA